MDKIAILDQYLPSGVAPAIARWIDFYQCQFKISRSRTTKLGDYRPPYRGLGHRISVNYNLNSYAFLVTTVHEFAHLLTWNEHKRKAKPHGKEWKQNFRYLLIKLRNSNRIPIILRDAIDAEADSLKGNIYSNHILLNAIKIVDKHAPQLVLHELPHNSHFKVVDRAETFRKKEKIRLRYKCYNLANKKWYTIYASTPVEKVN